MTAPDDQPRDPDAGDARWLDAPTHGGWWWTRWASAADEASTLARVHWNHGPVVFRYAVEWTEHPGAWDTDRDIAERHHGLKWLPVALPGETHADARNEGALAERTRIVEGLGAWAERTFSDDQDAAETARLLGEMLKDGVL